MKGVDARTSGRTEGGGGIVCDDHRRCCWSHLGQDLRGQGPDGLCACSTLCPQTWYETACTRWQRRLIGWEGICRLWDVVSGGGGEKVGGVGERRGESGRGKRRGEIPGETELGVCAPVGQAMGRWKMQAGGVADVINIALLCAHGPLLPRSQWATTSEHAGYRMIPYYTRSLFVHSARFHSTITR